MAREDIEVGTACGPIAVGVHELEPLQNLARAPAISRVLRENQINDRLRGGIRRHEWRTTLLL